MAGDGGDFDRRIVPTTMSFLQMGVEGEADGQGDVAGVAASGTHA